MYCFLTRYFCLLFCLLFSLTGFAQENRCLRIGSQEGAPRSVRINNPIAPASGFTIEMWLTTSAGSHNGSCADETSRRTVLSVGSNAFGVAMCEGGLYPVLDGVVDVATLLTDVDPDDQFHLSVTQTEAGLITYLLDGEPVAQIDRDYIELNQEPIIIGPSGQSDIPLDGDVDEIRIWNYARTADEVDEDFDCALLGDEPGLLNYFPCDQGISGDVDTDNRELLSGLLPLGSGASGDLVLFLNNTLTHWRECSQLDCGGTTVEPVASCDDDTGTNVLNLSTGIDAAGAVLPFGSVDPFWRLINIPPTTGTPPATIAPPTLYTIPTYNPGPGNLWWNSLDLIAPQAGILSPRNTPSFGLNNTDRTQPWRFSRSFCVCEETEVNFRGALQADDTGVLQLYHQNNLSTPLQTLASSVGGLGSTTHFRVDAPINYTANLQPGRYTLEFELENRGAVAMGAVAAVEVSTTGGGLLLRDNPTSCQSGVLTIQKTLDRNCDEEFTGGEGGLANWQFTITETTTGATYTGTTDAFGEIVLRNIPFGTYQIDETPQAPWMPSYPMGGTTTVIISADNPTGIAIFGNKNPESCSCVGGTAMPLLDDDGQSNCCYSLTLDNDFGPYYDAVSITATGFDISLLNALATFGTVTVQGNTILITGIVPQANDIPAIEFCTENLDGASDITLTWFFEEEPVCETTVAVECPDPCPAFQVQNTSEEDCCLAIDFDRVAGTAASAVRFTIPAGAKFDRPTVVLPVGYVLVTDQATTLTVATTTGTPLPVGVNDLLLACLKEVTVPTQEIVATYLGADFVTAICADTLVLECPVSPTCLTQNEYSPQLECEEDGYRLRMIFEKSDDYIDSIGFITVGLTGPDGYNRQIDWTLVNHLGPGQTIVLDTFLNDLPGEPGDSLCFLIAAHDDEDQRLCCFVDSLCIPIPVCNPCDYIDVYTVTDPEDSCCVYVVVDNQMPIPGFFDSIVIDTVPGQFYGATYGVADFLPNNNWVSTGNQGNAAVFVGGSGPGLDTILYICQDPTTATDSTRFSVDIFGQRELLCTDTFATYCPLDPCDSLSAYVLPVEGDSCCYDVYVSNTYDLTPALQSVSLELIDGPEPLFAGRSLIATAPGWNLATVDEEYRRFTLTGTGGTIPTGTDQQVFQFCLAESFSLDSSYVKIDWLTEADTICSDTVAAICHDCMELVDPTWGCNTDGAANLTFTFTNYSGIPANTVRIIRPTGTDTITLTQMVAPGATYTGTIVVDNIPGNVGDEVCFDIVLEQVLPGGLAIECCYVSFCGILPDCGGAGALTAFPNPSSGSVTLTSTRLGDAQVSLLSSNGNRMLSRPVRFTGRGTVFELGRQRTGVYTILVNYADGTQAVRRIIIR